MAMNLNTELSPHTLQNHDSFYTDSFYRVMADDFPMEPYRRRRGEDKTAVHFGQRALLLTEIEFLTDFLNEVKDKLKEKNLANASTEKNSLKKDLENKNKDDKSTLEDLDDSTATKDLENALENLNLNGKKENTGANDCKSVIKTIQQPDIVLIYVGAAGGTHLQLLSQMFPSVQFVLIDPNEFNVHEGNNVIIDRRYFNNNLAKHYFERYKDCTRLYVSDIRNSDFQKNERPGQSKMNEQYVLKDQRMQMDWYNILKPKKSLLKFRLIYPDSGLNVHQYEYLNGKIYILPWSPNTSTETRLLVGENANTRQYDVVKYEQQLFRHNTVERTLCYKHDIQVDGIDHCYDCRAEVQIISNYVALQQHIPDYLAGNVNSVQEIINRINTELQNNGRRLVRMTYNQNDYDVYFNDMRYGKRAEEIFNAAALDRARRRGNHFTVYE